MELTPGRHGRAAFIFIFVTVALDMLALGVMIPVLPQLIAQFQGGDISAAANTVGVFGFVWALMQFVFQPVLGAASDRFGRRPVVLLSNIGLGLDYLLMALAPNLWFLFAGRLINGICAASFSTAQAYIADITPPEGRAARYGMLGAAFGLGFVIGPAVGGPLGALDLRAPFWTASALSLLNFLYGYFVLPESLAPENRSATFIWRGASIVGGLRLLRGSRVLTALGGAMFLYYLAHESLPSIFVLYVDHRYGWDTKTTGLALALVGVGSAIVSGGLTRPFVKRFGEWSALTVGLLSGAVAFAVYALAPSGGWFLAGIAPGALWGLSGPGLQALMSREIGAGEQGRLQGALGGLRGITGMVGPLLFATIFATSLRAGGFPGWAYALAGALLLASLGVALSGRSPKS